jgi:hypothetical protein
VVNDENLLNKVYRRVETHQNSWKDVKELQVLRDLVVSASLQDLCLGVQIYQIWLRLMTMSPMFQVYRTFLTEELQQHLQMAVNLH